MFGPEYHKINTVFKRDEKGIIMPNEFTKPEFGYLRNNNWRWTEKIDGTNIRIFWDGGEDYTVGGRTDRANVPAGVIAAIRATLGSDAARLAAILQASPDAPVTLYGEGYGPGIQKGGGNYGDEQKFILFDVRIGTWYLKPEDAAQIAGSLGLDVVPEIGVFSLGQAIDGMQRSEYHSKFPNVIAEGIVGTPDVPLRDRAGNRIIAKLKYRDFDAYAEAMVKKYRQGGPKDLKSE